MLTLINIVVKPTEEIAAVKSPSGSLYFSSSAHSPGALSPPPISWSFSLQLQVMSDNWAVNLAREESHYQQKSYSPPFLPPPGACCYPTLVPPAHCEYEYMQQQKSSQFHRSNADDGKISFDCNNYSKLMSSG